MDAVEISIIIPTLNEAENLPVLVPRIAAALSDRRYEIVIVDDNSRDNTRAVCAELGRKYPVELIVREHPTNGLSGAVLEGMKHALGLVLVVMDADLQHPPEKLPELIAPLRDGADFVIGSRYIKGGTTEQQWGVLRRINSWVATILARPFSGRITDPMAGFFALRRGTYENAQRLTPLGYKIGLELMCKCRVQRVREIPIHFATRHAGQSKLSIKQQFRYLEHLSRLYDFSYPKLSPIVKFLIVTACAWFAGFALYAVLLKGGAFGDPALAPIASYPAAIVATAIFHLRYVRTQREFIMRTHPWRDFWIISLAEWAACAMSAVWVTYRVKPVHALELFVISFGCATVVRYALRKEFLHDIRGLRRKAGREEIS